MSARLPHLALALSFLFGSAAQAGEKAPPSSPAALLWERGQDAMRSGEPDVALDCYQRSLKLDPTLSCNHLSLAAAYLEKGENENAAQSMKKYLELRPDHIVIRLHYAELLSRMRKFDSARDQLERFIADAQQMPETGPRYLVDGHSRLMELAEGMDDAFREHLNRGIGLYLLGCHVARNPDSTQPAPSAESLLCKAAAELTLARLEQPSSARPAWYLHEVWSQLAQRQPATRWLRVAEAKGPFSDLTPAERRCLETACRDVKAEVGRR